MGTSLRLLESPRGVWPHLPGPVILTPSSSENEGRRARQRQPSGWPDLPFPPPPRLAAAFFMGPFFLPGYAASPRVEPPPHKHAPQPQLGDWASPGALAAAAMSTCLGFCSSFSRNLPRDKMKGCPWGEQKAGELAHSPVPPHTP